MIEREREREVGWWVPPAYYTVSPEYCISPTGTLTLQDDITRFGGWEERLISSQRERGMEGGRVISPSLTLAESLTRRCQF